MAVAGAAGVVLAAAAACGQGGPDASDALDRPEGARGAGSALGVAGAAPPGGGTFGFGTAATPERIARHDLDVRPDGQGLPAGSGGVERGAAVFAASCAACHGATGTEGPFDALVGGAWPADGFPRGRTVGSYWPYATTLYDYVRRAMPQDRPGTLSADDTYAVIAWILNRNGVVGADAVMDRTTLPRVEMPARDRFVEDDRTDGPDIR